MRYYKLISTNWYKIRTVVSRSPRLVWGAAIGVAGLAYLKVWLPATGIGIPCIFHQVTGLFCPGCGITRALSSLLTGQWAESFRYHPLIYILIPLYGLYIFTKRKDWRFSSKFVMGIMLTLTVLFGILRNFPYFTWLAPPIS